jgi:hypothetical protein
MASCIKSVPAPPNISDYFCFFVFLFQKGPCDQIATAVIMGQALPFHPFLSFTGQALPLVAQVQAEETCQHIFIKQK